MTSQTHTTTTTTTSTTTAHISHNLRERLQRQHDYHSGSRVHDPDSSVTTSGHGRGETIAQHSAHLSTPRKPHFGLTDKSEDFLFWCLAIPSWFLQIAAAVTGSYFHTWGHPFIATMTPHLVLHWAAWLQTAVGMAQRASWVRDESDLVDRRRFLVLAVRLNGLMMPTAIISLAVFIQAYARRFDTGDLAYWLLFLLSFIWNIVFSVMNAYNNITWENDRLNEEGEIVYRHTRLAVLGIAT